MCQYGSRRADCEESARILGVDQLVDVIDLDEASAALGDERLAARTRHVVSEIARTRAFIELLDEGPLEAFRSAGVGPFKTFFFGVLPQVLPTWLGTIFYRLETNVRQSTVLGMVGDCSRIEGEQLRSCAVGDTGGMPGSSVTAPARLRS